jgi:mevalonate kinase
LETELKNGLYFESNVLCGYGTGSSGVLCAAIYNRFGIDKIAATFLNLNILKQGFAQMECYFHGKSSGVDPLICYLNEPLLITSQGVVTVNLPAYLNKGNAIFLLDTKMPRKAEPLIQWFMKSAELIDFQNNIKENLVNYNNSAIAAFLEGHWSNLMKASHQISDFQLRYLTPLIPQPFHSVWQQGLENDLFKLKICGAGGGGFILGVTRDFEGTEKLLKDYTILKVFS